MKGYAVKRAERRLEAKRVTVPRGGKCKKCGKELVKNYNRRVKYRGG